MGTFTVAVVVVDVDNERLLRNALVYAGVL